MKKFVRLTERDLSRIVKQVIVEKENFDTATKIEKIIETPKIENRLERIVSNMTEKDINKLKRTLKKLGIDEYTSAEEVYNKVKEFSDDDEIGGEMSEHVYDKEKRKKENVSKILGDNDDFAHISGVIGAVAKGFTRSIWGMVGVLMGLAKLLSGKE